MDAHGDGTGGADTDRFLGNGLEMMASGAFASLATAVYAASLHDWSFDNLISAGYSNAGRFLAVLVAGWVLLYVLLRRRSFTHTLSQRLGFAVFAAVPALVLSVYTFVHSMDIVIKYNAVRVLFVMFATILPASLYYLFLETRRVALLNTFLADLRDMGLLPSRPEDADRFRDRAAGYLERFQSSFGVVSEGDADTIFEQVVNGRSANGLSKIRFNLPITAILPVVLVTLVCAVGWMIAMPPLVAASYQDSPLLPKADPVSFAFLGAYFFSIQLLIWRYMGRDLTPDAYVGVLKRILLAVMATWVIVNLPEFADADLREKLAIAFAAGVFPTIIWELLAGMAKRFPLIDKAIPSLREQFPLSMLDGLNIWHQSRLEDEDICSVQNMAAADVVDLLINTRFDASRVVDWVDQAILLTVIAADNEEDRKLRRETLRQFGIRGATDLIAATEADWISGEIASTTLNRPIPVTDWIASLLAAARSNPNFSIVLNWRRELTR